MTRKFVQLTSAIDDRTHIVLLHALDAHGHVWELAPMFDGGWRRITDKREGESNDE